MRTRTDRREFLKGTAAAGAGVWIARNRARAESRSPNEKLNIALVGVDGRGKWFVDTLPRLGENVVALCDVDDERSAEAFARLPQAQRFSDFRVMLDKMHKQIDAVLVATPDHTHAVIAAAAMKAGKHVYCEKPLTHDVYEARVIREMARTCGVATQMGNQGTSSGEFRKAVELIRAGILGQIREVIVWNSGGGAARNAAPRDSHPVPGHFKWDIWLGPATRRDYHGDWTKWHAWRDFATGQLGNWASHSASLAFMALKIDALWHARSGTELGSTLRVKADVSEISDLSFPRWEIIQFDLPARGDLPPVTFRWYNGEGAPGARERIEDLMGRRLDWGDAGERTWQDHAGALIVGTRGKLHATGHNATTALVPADALTDLPDSPRILPRSKGHERDWIEACKGGPPAMSNFDHAGPLAEFLLLGNVATRFDHELAFDPVVCRITNHERADQALRREYRPGWSL